MSIETPAARRTERPICAAGLQARASGNTAFNDAMNYIGGYAAAQQHHVAQIPFS